MRVEKMETFIKNLEGQGFSQEFIKKSVNYFTELEEEREVQEIINIEEVIEQHNKCGSYTCNILETENNLKELRGDIALLKDEYPELLDLNLYFTNIEHFEISILYLLYFGFYHQ